MKREVVRQSQGQIKGIVFEENQKKCFTHPEEETAMHAACVCEKVRSSAHHSYGCLAHLINDLMCVCVCVLLLLKVEKSQATQ